MSFLRRVCGSGPPPNEIKLNVTYFKWIVPTFP